MNIEQARFNMLQQQIRPWDVVDDRVIGVMQEIPREHFVPNNYQQLAFSDTEIPLGHDQYMMEPKIEARMLQALAIKSSDRILEIGTGSGFVTACLASLGAKVVSVDIHSDFVESAREKLAALSISNVDLHTADAVQDAIPGSPFDVIAITASLPEPTDRFAHMLEPGGRLFSIVGDGEMMDVQLVTRVNGGNWKTESLFETHVAAMINATRTPEFSF